MSQINVKNVLMVVIALILIHSLFRCATSENFSARRGGRGGRSGGRSGGARIGGRTSGYRSRSSSPSRHSVRPTSSGARYGKRHHQHGGGTYYGGSGGGSYYPWYWYDYISPWSWYNYYYPVYYDDVIIEDPELYDYELY